MQDRKYTIEVDIYELSLICAACAKSAGNTSALEVEYKMLCDKLKAMRLEALASHPVDSEDKTIPSC